VQPYFASAVCAVCLNVDDDGDGWVDDAVVEYAAPMKQRVEALQKGELHVAWQLDQQEVYLALPEFLGLLVHHLAVVYLVHLVYLQEVSVDLPTRVIVDLAI